MELIREDIDVLIEALSAWETEKIGSAMISGMITAMVAKDKDAGKLEVTEHMAIAEGETQERREISVMLKAKLYLMKNKLEE